MSVYTIIITYVITINLIAFFLMGLDKWKARKRAWRIPEVTLFLFAIFGGSIGSILVMFLSHHKTRHWYFRYGFPLLAALDAALLLWLRLG